MASNHADATVAIPWFNNIWLSDVATRVSSPTPHSTASTTTATPPRRTRPNHPTPSSLSTPESVAVHDTPSYTVVAGSTSSATASLAPSSNDLNHLNPSALTESQYQASAQLQSYSWTESRNQTPSESRSVSSSRQTISTLSAVDRISLISLFSTGRASASDILRTLSDPDLVHLARTPVPLAISEHDNVNGDTDNHVNKHIVPIRSAPHIRTPSSFRSSPIDDATICTTVTPVTTVRRVASTPSNPP